MLRLIRHASTQSLPFRVAIVGSGPAGFYTAHHLYKLGAPVAVDFYERLPAPYGLSRYGVAPDHPEVKNCEEYLDLIMDNQKNLRFIGNVTVGEDIALDELKRQYHAVVLSYGSTATDNTLGIPGEDAEGIIPARQFVNWYNSHPDAANWQPPDFSKIRDVTIIGNGNVAMDVARVLIGLPLLHWDPTDIALATVKALQKSAIETVSIVGRRGVLQLAFANKELRELLEMAALNQFLFKINSDELNAMAGKKLGRVEKRRLGLLEKYVGTGVDSSKVLSFEYNLAPKLFLTENGKVKGVEYNINKTDDLGKATPTGETTTEPADLVITLIGYKGSLIDNNLGIGFAKNHILNDKGRVLTQDSQPIPGLYCSGWIKTGPKGVIATTMLESFDTAELILEDFKDGKLAAPEVEPSLPSKAISWTQWGKLDEFEVSEGERLNKLRLKVDNTPGMLAIEDN